MGYSNIKHKRRGHVGKTYDFWQKLCSRENEFNTVMKEGGGVGKFPGIIGYERDLENDK